jgi:hypothetical protein
MAVKTSTTKLLQSVFSERVSNDLRELSKTGMMSGNGEMFLDIQKLIQPVSIGQE